MKGALVITGGGTGLGKAVARAASLDGYPLALIGRNKNHLEEARKELQANAKQKVSIHTADLTNPGETSRAFQEIAGAHGGVEALVNSAATWMGRKECESLTMEDVLSSFQLNFLTAFNATSEALKIRKSKGNSLLAIVNVGATASLRGGIQTASFCIAKAALRSFSQSLSKELGPQGVHVAHLVIDGVIDNERTRNLNPVLSADRYLDPASIAKTILHVIQQDKSCWTFEWDVRPHNEKW